MIATEDEAEIVSFADVLLSAGRYKEAAECFHAAIVRKEWSKVYSFGPREYKTVYWLCSIWMTAWPTTTEKKQPVW